MIRILVDEVINAYANAAVPAIAHRYLEWHPTVSDRLLTANALGIVLLERLGGMKIRYECDQGSAYETLVVEKLGITPGYRRGFFRAFQGLPDNVVRADCYPDYHQGYRDGEAAREAVIERGLTGPGWH